MTRKHSLSENYGDGTSKYYALGEREREARKKQQREYQQRIYEQSPKVPNRPWSRAEMADLFTTTETNLDYAIRNNRNYEDVRTCSMELTRAFHREPWVLATFIDLSEVQVRTRLAADRGENFHVCDECFTFPHQISCSRAD